MKIFLLLSLLYLEIKRIKIFKTKETIYKLYFSVTSAFKSGRKAESLSQVGEERKRLFTYFFVSIIFLLLRTDFLYF